MTGKRNIVYVVFYLSLIGVLWAGITLLPGPHREVLSEPSSAYDLRDYDFEDTVYLLDANWDAWPDELYDPSELSDRDAPLSSKDIDFASTRYVSYELNLNLQPDASYGISFYSARYSMRLYVDGIEAVKVGNPGTTREETVHGGRDVTYYFTPLDDSTQIVVQVSNFAHHVGAQPPDLTIGAQQDIVRLERESNIRSGLIIGCIIAAFLYHLGIFLLNRYQRTSLMFAVLCLLLACQASEPVLALLAGYDWFLVTRIEYLVNLGALIALLLLIKNLFPKVINVGVYWAYVAFCALYGIVVLFTDSTFYTQFLLLFQGVSVAFSIYILVVLALNLREKTLKNTSAFLGVFLVGVCGIGDVLCRTDLVPAGLANSQTLTIGTGLVLFVSCYVLVMAIEQAEVNKKFADMHRAVAEAESRYAELVEQKQGKSTLSERFADSGLTKRESEVASLLLNGKSREEIARLLSISLGTVNTHCTSVYRKMECNSVGELAHQVNPDWFSS